MSDTIKLERVDLMDFYERDGNIGLLWEGSESRPNESIFCVMVLEVEDGHLKMLRLDDQTDVTPRPDKTKDFIAFMQSTETQGELF